MQSLTALETVTSIHGANAGSRVHFCSKSRQHWNELASVPADRIEQVFPIVAPHLIKDAYFSINGFSKPSRRNNAETGLPKPAAKKENLQVLNGILADVDCGRPDAARKASRQDTQEAMFQTIEKLDKLGVPHPTYWIESGQGFNAVWIFDQPLRAWPEVIARLEDAQRSLSRIHPAFDQACVNSNRVLRVPGTIHGTTKQPAIWRADATGANKYEAEELWAKLGIDSARASRYSVTQKPGTCSARIVGRYGLFAKIERELLDLHRLRGGFTEGTRRYALTLYAAAKMNQRQSPFTIQGAVAALASECQPAYPSHINDISAAQIMRGAKAIKNEHRKAATIIKRLGITQAEATLLEFETLNPKFNKKREQQAQSRAQNIGRPNRIARHQFVEAFLKANPDAKNRAILLAAKSANIKTSLATIKRDRTALAI